MQSLAFVMWLCMAPRASSEQFWLSVVLHELQWLGADCNVDDACAQPALNLKLFNTVNNETISKTAQVFFDERKDKLSPLVAYWNSGSPEAVTLVIEIKGTDSMYHFPRICDTTSTTALFQSGENAAMVTREKTLVVSGNCFKTRVTYIKFVDNCPWCAVSTLDKASSKSTQTFTVTVLTAVIICFAAATALTSILAVTSQAVRWKLKKSAKMNEIPLSTLRAPHVNSNSSEEMHESTRKSERFSTVMEPESLNLEKLPLAMNPSQDLATFSPNQWFISANSSFCNSEMIF